MKNYLFSILLLLVMPAGIYAQNDCADAIVVCGNSNFNGLNATGAGIQELSSNTCGVNENNSLWLKVLIKNGGTFGFMITPDSNDLEVDYDFFVFGPTASCNSLGFAIRCSTTNPIAAGLSYNTTGLTENAADTAQGPGEDGNGYVQWINASDNDVYYIVIDRPIGSSNFSLQWTGTATFQEGPVFFKPDAGIPDIAQCDADSTDDNATSFDLTVHESTLIGAQTDVAVTYHLSINDMITGENPIATPQAYTNVTSPQTIYLRMTNTLTGCYSNDTFRIRIEDATFDGVPENLTLCDDNDNGLQVFDLWENNALLTGGDANINVTYYRSRDDANYETNPITRFYTNSLPYTTETVWARLEYFTGCFGYQTVPFTISVPPPADFSYTLDIDDLTEGNNSVTVNMDSGNNLFEFSIDGVSFTENNTFQNLLPGIYTLYVRDKNYCDTARFEVPILSYPRFFTPNGDSYNDSWDIRFMRYFPDAYITIFDRFGRIIDDYHGREKGWDGTYNGKPLPADDYWFVITFTTGRTVKGHFSLIR